MLSEDKGEVAYYNMCRSSKGVVTHLVVRAHADETYRV
jgi:hypothetical protein